MIKSVIIDDDPVNVRILKGMIEEYCLDIEIAGEAGNAKDGAELITALKPQLVFLDIEMPYGNGFDMLQALMPVSFEVIFVTAFDTYMLNAFKYAALGYLLKPVSIEDLKNVVATARKRINIYDSNEQLNLLMDNFRKSNVETQKIAIPSQDGYEFIPISDIIMCEAKGSYTEIHLFRKKNKIVVAKTLKEYEMLLPEDVFFRVHNSHIININHIKKYYKGRGGYIEMHNGEMIEVAARRKLEFLKKLGLGS